jgi:hypothetical protein
VTGADIFKKLFVLVASGRAAIMDVFVVQNEPSKLYDAAVHGTVALGTVKLVADVPVTPPTATVIAPVVAPVGTVVVIVVAVDAETVAVVPLNFTVLFTAVVLKFVPVMVTEVPTAPDAGAKLVIVGAVELVTVKLVADVAVAATPATATVIGPVVAPVGTVVVIEVAVDAETVAAVPLNFTVLLAGVVLKFVPVMVTVFVGNPDVGVKLAIVGSVALTTVKFVADVPATPATATVIGPVVAPVGTVVVIEVAVDAETVAAVPLNFTVLFAAVVLKFVPVMVTVAPTTPDAGVKLVMVGVGGTVTV